MIRRTFVTAAVLTVVGGAALVRGQAPPAPQHVAFVPAELTWGPAPPALPPGAQMAVMSGDPGKPEPFTIRAKMPAGYKVMPHWHPTAENLTIISGTFAVGMGEKFDEKTLKALPAGSFASMPAEMRHFAVAQTAVVIQVHGTGPFTLTYVNPADDPRQKKPVQ
jgi:hypothetical protein